MSLDMTLPEGRVGHLSAEHEKILKQFWDKFLSMDDSNMVAEADPATDGKKQSHADVVRAYWASTLREDPDAIMLRFLRARSWSIERAMAMMVAAFKWRNTFGVEEVCAKGEPGYNKELEKFTFICESGKAYLHGADLLDRPVFYIHVQLHRPKDQPGASLEKFTVYNLETGRLFLPPSSGQCCLVFDMTNFGLKNMDWNFIYFLVKSFEAYYPESLGLVVIHNAPWVFWGVWKVLAPLLDPVVRQKITFTRNVEELTTFIKPERLPKEMGGKEEWKWQYHAPGTAATAKCNDAKEKEAHMATVKALREKFEANTREWIKPSAGKELQAERDALALDLKIASRAADPYVQPLSNYHETGILLDDGTVQWEYKSAAGVQKLGTTTEALKALKGDSAKISAARGKLF